MLERFEHGQIVELRMNRPPANALNSELLVTLRDGLRDAADDGAAALVVSGRPGMFSAGLDVPELIELDRPAIQSFWSDFFELMRTLAASPVPVVAAITGHSPAGGAVIAVHCDYRVATAGDWKIGFNEVQVGLPVPSTILGVLTELVGYRAARRLAGHGLLVSAAEALDVGLVDELAEAEQVIPAAVNHCSELLRLPPIAMNQTRLELKARLLQSLEMANDVVVATDYWFSDETQQAMRALVDKLRG